MLKLLSEDELMKDYVLSKMIRYNTRRKLQQENVAEHSYFVVLFCLKIMKQLNLTDEQERDVLAIAALHDVAERITSDVPYDVKQRNAGLSEMLRKIEDDFYAEEWEDYADKIADDGSLPNLIVKLADSYSVLQYSKNEVSLGNTSKDMLDILTDATRRCEWYNIKINEKLEEV